MNFTIRKMSADDLAAVMRIQEDAYARHFLESPDIIAQRFNLSPDTAWVAERNLEVCAYLVGYWSQVGKVNPLHAPFSVVENADCLYLHDLALLASAQGSGLAKKLIEIATEYAIQSSVKSLALLSVQNSKAFWQKFGFVEIDGLDQSQHQHLAAYHNAEELAYYMIKFIALK